MKSVVVLLLLPIGTIACSSLAGCVHEESRGVTNMQARTAAPVVDNVEPAPTDVNVAPRFSVSTER